ncbi:hypothetical protein [Xanthovirga aplysinae]|uniref:hypothetical protein n=1 Tax=Xanthovirga aplysinae TaxID=2529853 RepID=UPI0012BBF476|nr:hypothetical protein [Xanthovirga aplysinae]MTI30062.1 hypothetical protein [Xanthovirga aplysinae]
MALIENRIPTTENFKMFVNGQTYGSTSTEDKYSIERAVRETVKANSGTDPGTQTSLPSLCTLAYSDMMQNRGVIPTSTQEFRGYPIPAIKNFSFEVIDEGGFTFDVRPVKIIMQLELKYAVAYNLPVKLNITGFQFPPFIEIPAGQKVWEYTYVDGSVWEPDTGDLYFFDNYNYSYTVTSNISISDYDSPFYNDAGQSHEIEFATRLNPFDILYPSQKVANVSNINEYVRTGFDRTIYHATLRPPFGQIYDGPYRISQPETFNSTMYFCYEFDRREFQFGEYEYQYCTIKVGTNGKVLEEKLSPWVL